MSAFGIRRDDPFDVIGPSAPAQRPRAMGAGAGSAPTQAARSTPTPMPRPQGPTRATNVPPQPGDFTAGGPLVQSAVGDVRDVTMVTGRHAEREAGTSTPVRPAPPTPKPRNPSAPYPDRPAPDSNRKLSPEFEAYVRQQSELLRIREEQRRISGLLEPL